MRDDFAALMDGELIERLKQLAADCGQKSMTARLVAVIGPVEAILARGYDRSQVRSLLIEAGWRFTPDSFDSALSRVRRRSVPSTDIGADEEEASKSIEANNPAPEFAEQFARPRVNWNGSQY